MTGKGHFTWTCVPLAEFPPENGLGVALADGSV